ncbi:unnamed protein product, partial [Vitis vinifera]|uniref:Uncharacterized protein n=1 Tax=Vitis vinifera TaxID=29760 RepID=D7UA44_VITVI
MVQIVDLSRWRTLPL